LLLWVCRVSVSAVMLSRTLDTLTSQSGFPEQLGREGSPAPQLGDPLSRKMLPVLRKRTRRREHHDEAR
jgi:hypothetical protein